MLRIALTVFDRPLRWPVIALAIFYALDGMTSHMTAGTLFRRLLVLVLTVAGLMVVAWVSLARSRVPALFARRGWTMAGVFVRFAAICLAASGMCNIVGSVSLADLLLHGTLQSIWWAMAVYLMYLVLGALIAVLSMTQLGQISRLVRLHRERVLARVDTMLKLASWTVWVGGLLFAYQIARYTFAGFRSALNYKWSIGAVTFTIREVFLFFLVLLVASSVAKAVRFFLEEELLPHTPLRPGVAQACSRLTHYALALIGFYLAMAAAGMNLGRATLLTGAFGVGLGFGLQGLVSNFVSGIIISLERPMQVGDVIEVGHLLGKVTTIGFRSSTIRTADGAEVIVPNSELTTKSFVNWSLTDQLRRGELRVGVAYGTEPSRVLEILARVAGAHPAVVKHPSPSAGFERFGESALEFFLRFWTDVEKLDSVRSDLNVLVAEELGKSRITVALPQRDVHLHMSEASSETNGRLPEKSGFSAKEAEYLITK